MTKEDYWYILRRMEEHPFIAKSGWLPEMVYGLSLALIKAKTHPYLSDGNKFSVRIGTGNLISRDRRTRWSKSV